ncbi:MATH domain and coiled-coil domain-containing protein At2g42480 isoform X1 [Brassica rapa]|uniref:MATH domain and coiled-coil domain-containing protein At2g42480 isoform X1 n=1 Tax=Brassica campestris TaxID=3711 RepID=UPI00142D3A14|nr:MATH domain and coiled-coil domain-containing protein At2g42480 isoform X1 [Brassica rapa]
MWNQKPCFRFEIDNLSEKKAVISSKTFVTGGCEWYLDIYPKGDRLANGHLSMYLSVANSTKLRTGWKRSVNYYFVLLNQSDKELHRSPSNEVLFLLFLMWNQVLSAFDSLSLSLSLFVNVTCVLGRTIRRFDVATGNKPKLMFEQNAIGEKVYVIVILFYFILCFIVGQGVNLYCASHPSWGFGKVLPVSKFQEKGFLEKDKLIIEVYIKVIEAFDGEEVSNNKKNKTVDINGFQVFASQVTKVGKIFTDHPDIALDVKPTKQEVKTAYMHVLLRVIKTLNKPPKSLSDTRLNKASSDLSELMDVGFKLDWLKLKFDEVSLERKKADDTNESRAQRLEKRAKKLELMELDFKLDSLNRKKADDTKESLDKEVEKRAAQIELGFNRRLNKKLGDLERKRSYDTSVFDSQIKQIEGHVMGLGLKLDSLNTKLEEMSKEKKKADDDADVTLVQELKNLELMVSDIKVELDKKKNISSDDGFLLVD